MDLQSAIRDWDSDVQSEAERLIRLGVPPYDAAVQARQRVDQRRREAAAQITRSERPESA